MILSHAEFFLFKKGVTGVLCVLLISVLFQCQSAAGIQGKKNSTAFETRTDYKQFVQQYSTWRYQGRIGLTFPYEGKRKAVSANIEWQQNNYDFDMVMSGPLGMGRFTLEKRASETVLTNNKGEKYISSSPESMFYEHAGIQIPWSELSWWVRALPIPNQPFTEVPSQDFAYQLKQLQQSGWVIDYPSYDDFEQSVLPRKIKFSNGEINGTLLVRAWELVADE